MNIDWTAVLVALLGSNLLLEIVKTIKESIQKRKKIDVEANLADIKTKLSTDYNRLNQIENTLTTLMEVMMRNSEGTILSLQDDVVIFNALRHNHINGESEEQEKKLQEYYKKCAASNFQFHIKEEAKK